MQVWYVKLKEPDGNSSGVISLHVWSQPRQMDNLTYTTVIEKPFSNGTNEAADVIHVTAVGKFVFISSHIKQK